MDKFTKSEDFRREELIFSVLQVGFRALSNLVECGLYLKVLKNPKMKEEII